MAQTKIQERLHLPIFRGNMGDWASEFSREVQTNWLRMAIIVNNGGVPVYYDNDEPTINDNSLAIWVDADGGPKYYLIINYDGTQKKLEFT